MIEDAVRQERWQRPSGGERTWQLLAAALAVGGTVFLALLGGLGFGLSGIGDSAAAVGRSVDAVVRSPGEGGPPALGPGWRHTPTNAVIFYGGYFCAHGPDGRRVRLVLALRELDTLTNGNSSVTGPYSSKARSGGAC